jgi:hypothetical protein
VYGRLPANPGAASETVLHVVASGVAPLDDYCSQVLGYGRWGDYTAAVSDGTLVWVAGEYVPARPRIADPNWGTFITRVGDDEPLLKLSYVQRRASMRKLLTASVLLFTLSATFVAFGRPGAVCRSVVACR